MRILPIQNQKGAKPNFKGYLVNSFGYADAHLRAAENTGRRMEETTGYYHPCPTYKIYYADPLEIVSEAIKEKVDYIVYDDEPTILDVDLEASKMYFSPFNQSAHHDFSKSLNNFREYFYRLEMMDQKAVQGYANDQEKVDYFKAHIADAQYNQETAATALGILNEGYSKVEERNRYNYYMRNNEYQIQRRTEEITKAEHELKQREEMHAALESKISSLEAKKTAYDSLLLTFEKDKIMSETAINVSKAAFDYNKANHTPYEKSDNYTEILSKPISTEQYSKFNSQLTNDLKSEKEEANIIKSQIEKIKTRINKYKEDLKENDLILQKVGQYKNELPAIIEGLKQELARNTELFEKAKAELIPQFEHLKNYLLSRGVRSIK